LCCINIPAALDPRGDHAADPALQLHSDGISHFCDGIEALSETEKRVIAEAPVPDGELMKELGLGSTDGAPEKLIGLHLFAHVFLGEPAVAHGGAVAREIGGENARTFGGGDLDAAPIK
jgi:hypothetical protein